MQTVHRYERLPSTQDEAHRLAAEGAPAGTVVVAAEQISGRGTRGRNWVSPLGGLWLSFLCRPVRLPAVEVLSLRVGLAASDALSEVGGLPPVSLKWPNDLIVNDRKVGGILCEARWHGDALAWVVVGLGMNVRNPLPSDARLAPARLAEWRPDLEPDHILWPLVGALLPLAEAASGLSAAELRTFGQRDWLLGRELAEPERGRAAGIESDGALRVLKANGQLVRVSSGSVVLAEDAA
jgi:BirA family biotin operon repressor/biotin-[acetyl-CoA-carboxylase] ligase